MAGNMRRNIEVTDGQVDHVGEVIQVAISGGSIFHDLDDTVQALTNGIGQVSVDEGHDEREVSAQGADERA